MGLTQLNVKVQEIHKYGPLRVADSGSVKPIATSKSSVYQTIRPPLPQQTQVRNAPNRMEVFCELMLRDLYLPPLDSEKLYHSDGRRRSRPKASTVHGWLVKWRATFSGNERLRKEGIREMREAKAVREYKKEKKAARQAKAGVSTKERRSPAPKGVSRVSQHSSAKRPSRQSTRRLTSPTHSPRSTPANSRRSSHNRQGAGDRTPHSSRKASYSQGNAIRATKKKR